MKITCSVEVINRALPSLNISNKRSLRSNLIIGKNPDKEVFLLHQTNEDSCGKKYKVKNNIANVFVKFVNEGKATIRFKIPEHDLAIKCDPLQLKGFLRTLKLGLDGLSCQRLSTIQTNTLIKTVKPVKRNLKITSKEEYPVLEGFPRTLESLIINNVNQKSLDTRILRLRDLRVLNLEDNNLVTLPEQTGSSLPNLVELYLGKNSFGLSTDWRWIVNKKLQESLRLLDLNSNKITALPDKSVNLINLVTLKLDHNNIEYLPNAIGRMTKLRYLSASNNCISYLPGSVRHLQLDHIDLSRNKSCQIAPADCHLTQAAFQTVHSLVDLSALCVLRNQLPYSVETLPRTLIDHLETASFCVCGRACFPTYSQQTYVPYYSLSSKASTIVFSYDDSVCLVAVQYCSLFCYSKHKTAGF